MRTGCSDLVTVLAVTVGGCSVAVSVSWLAGSTWLLDTVGGPGALAGTLAGVLVLVAAVLVKTGVALLPLVPGVHARRLGLLAGWVLLVYGTALTVGGVLVLTDVISPAADADLRAIAWHTWLWDPWFAVWGALLLLSLRGRRGAGSVGRRTRGRDRRPARSDGPR